jgi:hypothetical protein
MPPSHQLVVLRRKVRGRARLTNNDRWFLVQMYRWFPSILPVLMIIRPETLVCWHSAGFRRFSEPEASGHTPSPELKFSVQTGQRPELVWLMLAYKCAIWTRHTVLDFLRQKL